MKVLLVEDNPGDVRLIQEMLKEVGTAQFKLGYVVRLNEALQRLGEEAFDMVLLDLGLPDSQGLDTLIRVHAQVPDVPIVVLTALADGDLGVKAVQQGAQDYLVKGQVDSSLLVRTMRYAIERKRAEEKLRQSEEKLRVTFESIKDGVIVTDLEGRIVDVNEATLRMQGHSREELIGTDGLRFIAEKDRAAVMKNMKKALKDMGTATMEYRWVAKDGSEYDSEASAALLRDSSGNPVGLIFVVRDITERKKIERMKSDFVFLVSHQLKTPVAEVKAYIENMLEGLTGDLTTKQEQYLQEMRDICSRNYRLISDLLDMSRIERGVVSLDIQPVELRVVVDSALRDRRKSIEEKGLALNLEEADKRVSVLADKGKMVEALSNVIDNAVKFTDKGLIAIEIKREGEYGIVEVRDTGKGMSDDVLKNLFTVVGDLSGAPTSGDGAGLGLYIAKSLMKLQKGDITATSVVGKGSIFVLKIPILKLENMGGKNI